MKIKGLNQLKKRIENLSKAIDDGTVMLLDKALLNINGDAVTTAQGISNQLQLRYKKETKYRGIIEASFTADNRIAAYINFGTGGFALQYLSDKDAGIKELAQQFYKNGQGRMPARPFLTDPFIKHRKIFIEDMKKLLKKSVK
jgi:hypothetical protein